MTDPIKRFLEVAVRPDPDEIDLAEAALVLSLPEYPDLDVAHWLGRIDSLADRLRPRLSTFQSAREQEDLLTELLFQEVGLRGNRETYYDPRNSYLNTVLERGLGIPITLAVIMIEVGTRVGIRLEGVGFPSHFLVRSSSSEVFLDPFQAGSLLTPSDCEQLLFDLTGGRMPFSPAYLRPVSKRQILARMLRNLKGVHLRQKQLELALLDVERLMWLEPEQSGERRDRGLIHLDLGRFQLAADDLRTYLEHCPDASDAERVRARLDDAYRQLWSMN